MRIPTVLSFSIAATASAIAGDSGYGKTEILIMHPAATITDDTLACRTKDDYSRMMKLLINDEESYKAFMLKKMREGICGPISKGTKIIVEEASSTDPMKVHIKGTTTILWIYVEAVTPDSKSPD